MGVVVPHRQVPLPSKDRMQLLAPGPSVLQRKPAAAFGSAPSPGGPAAGSASALSNLAAAGELSRRMHRLPQGSTADEPAAMAETEPAGPEGCCAEQAISNASELREMLRRAVQREERLVQVLRSIRRAIDDALDNSDSP